MDIKVGLIWYHSYQLGIVFCWPSDCLEPWVKDKRGWDANLSSGDGGIMNTSGSINGTASAAGIWLTGAIGLSVAYAHYEIAIVLSALGFLIFQVSSFFKHET